jgi:hypothetical protein
MQAPTRISRFRHLSLQLAVGMFLVVGLAPLHACALSTPTERGNASEFILPAPADHDGPAVSAQPVVGVEQQRLDESSAPAKPAAANDGADADTAMWREADASDNAETVKVYLLTYPQGRHVDAAKARFRDLLSALSPRRAAPPAIQRRTNAL